MINEEWEIPDISLWTWNSLSFLLLKNREVERKTP